MTGKENEKKTVVSGAEINWLGLWRNQYGSELEITSQENGVIKGVFRTALKESGIYGQSPAAIGVWISDLISFAVAGGKDIKIVVGYTGILRDGKMEALWQMAAGEKLTAEKAGAPAEKKQIEAWQAFVTGADTFERVG